MQQKVYISTLDPITGADKVGLCNNKRGQRSSALINILSFPVDSYIATIGLLWKVINQPLISRSKTYFHLIHQPRCQHTQLTDLSDTDYGRNE